MGQQLARVEPDETASLFAIPGCSPGPLGLTLDKDISFENWERVGRFLHNVERAVQWWIGDWLVFGEHKWGEKYAQAVGATGLEVQTLQNYQYVAGAVQISRRRENLTFSHHAEVASLAPVDQEALLDTAERDKLGVRQLRQRVEQAKVERQRQAKGDDTPLDREFISMLADWRPLRPQLEAFKNRHPLARRTIGGCIVEMHEMLAAPNAAIRDWLESEIDDGAELIDDLVTRSGMELHTINAAINSLVASGSYERADSDGVATVRPVVRAELLYIEDEDSELRQGPVETVVLTAIDHGAHQLSEIVTETNLPREIVTRTLDALIDEDVIETREQGGKTEVARGKRKTLYVRVGE